MTLPIDLVIVRHGQSEGNKAKRHAEAGRPAILDEVYANRHTSTLRLTDLGREQANDAGNWLREEFGHFDRYIVSEYIRAMETAGELGLANAKWYADFNLTERDWGSYDTATAEEREKMLVTEMQTRDIEPFFWSPPNGESFAQLCLRVNRVLHTLHRECSDKRVVLVCHGEVMWALRVCLERMSQKRFKMLHLSRDSKDRIHNCQIMHYTRRNPETEALSKYANWMRMVRPTQSPVWETGWQEIVRPTYTTNELLQHVSEYPAVLT